MEETAHKSGVLIFFGVLVGLLAFGIGVRTFMLRETSTANADKVANAQTVALDTNTPYSLNDVAKHNRPTNCWTIVDGAVYNITKLIKENQDITAFTGACGVDGTTIFANQQFTTGDIGADNKRALQPSTEILPKYKIGKIK